MSGMLEVGVTIKDIPALTNTSQDIKQGPWGNTESQHLRRDFEYSIETSGLFGMCILSRSGFRLGF